MAYYIEGNKEVSIYTDNLNSVTVNIANNGFYKLSIGTYDFVEWLNLNASTNFDQLGLTTVGQTKDIKFYTSKDSYKEITLEYLGEAKDVYLGVDDDHNSVITGNAYVYKYGTTTIDSLKYNEYIVYYTGGSPYNSSSSDPTFYYLSSQCSFNDGKLNNLSYLYRTIYASDVNLNLTLTIGGTQVFYPIYLPSQINSTNSHETIASVIEGNLDSYYIGETQCSKIYTVSNYNDSSEKYTFLLVGSYFYKFSGNDDLYNFKPVTQRYSKATTYVGLLNDGTEIANTNITTLPYSTSQIITKESLQNYDIYIKGKISDALESYAKSSDLSAYAKSSDLTNYITTSTLASNLASVANLGGGDFEKAIAKKITDYGYTTMSDVEKKNYITSSYLTDNKYITSSDLSDYAKTSDVISAENETFKNAVIAAVNAYLETNDGETAVFNAYLAAAKTSE